MSFEFDSTELGHTDTFDKITCNEAVLIILRINSCEEMYTDFNVVLNTNQRDSYIGWGNYVCLWPNADTYVELLYKRIVTYLSYKSNTNCSFRY